MLSCWQEKPNQRPSFQTLKIKFNNILASKGEDAYVDLCIDPNKSYYKTENETDIPPSRNRLQPSLSYKRKSKKVSPNGSFEGITISKTSPSPQASPRISHFQKNVSPTPSMDKALVSQPQNLNQRQNGRPSSMVGFKKKQNEEERRKSGLDQDLGKNDDERYVQDPSTLLEMRNAMFDEDSQSVPLSKK